MTFSIVIMVGRGYFLPTHVHEASKKTKGYAKEATGDIQKVDLGIALCHFEIAAAEGGLKGKFIQPDPDITTAEDREYIATYILEG